MSNGYTLQGSEWEKLAQSLYKVQKKRKELSKKEEEIKRALLELSGYRSSRSRKFLLQKIERIGPINYHSIPFLKTIDLDPYRTHSTIAWHLVKHS